MDETLLHFPERRRHLSAEEARFAADCVLSVPATERRAKSKDLQLEDPETLLILLRRLHEQKEISPATVRADAEFFYRFLERPKREIGLLDEREYFLGEFALIAGIACRFLSLRNEARLWLDRAETWFLQVTNELPHFARVSYQKLALRTEEREFAQVLELLPPLLESLQKLGMPAEHLKVRFLEAVVLKETEQFDKAIRLFGDIRREAKALGNGKLMGSAYVNLLQIYAFLGDAEQAFDLACEATPLLRQLDNRIDLAKLQLGLGYLLRKQRKAAEAIQAYRIAQKEFTEIEMKADVAAIHLVIADLLLELGQDPQARWEIQAALPVIDELKLVPEGVAALSLLRESLQNQRINHEALRDLHGYFEKNE